MEQAPFSVQIFAADADGNLTGTTYPNGDTVAQSYNADDQPTSAPLVRFVGIFIR